MPYGITARAKKYWPGLIEELRANGTLFESDSRIIGMTCEAMGIYYRINAVLEKDGLKGKGVGGADARHPLLGSLKEAWDRMVQGLDRLGLSPSSRTRIELQPKGTPKVVSELDAMWA